MRENDKKFAKHFQCTFVLLLALLFARACFHPRMGLLFAQHEARNWLLPLLQSDCCFQNAILSLVLPLCYAALWGTVLFVRRVGLPTVSALSALVVFLAFVVACFVYKWSLFGGAGSIVVVWLQPLKMAFERGYFKSAQSNFSPASALPASPISSPHSHAHAQANGTPRSLERANTLRKMLPSFPPLLRTGTRSLLNLWDNLSPSLRMRQRVEVRLLRQAKQSECLCTGLGVFAAWCCSVGDCSLRRVVLVRGRCFVSANGLFVFIFVVGCFRCFKHSHNGPLTASHLI